MPISAIAEHKHHDTRDRTSVRRAIPPVLLVLFVFLLLLFISVIYVGVSKSAIGIQGDTFDFSIRSDNRQSLPPSPPPRRVASDMVIDFTRISYAPRYTRTCDGLSVPLGFAFLNIMGCTTNY